MQLFAVRDKTAIVDATGSHSYAELAALIERWSIRFRQAEAHRVLILSENRADYPAALYGAWKAGADVIPVDAAASFEELRYIVDDSRPDAIVTSAQYEHFCRKLQTVVPSLFSMDGIRSTPASPSQSEYNIDDPDKTALIIYTSGTTGAPKGVMLSFGNIMSNVHAVSNDVAYFTERETVLMLLPVHHILPLMGTIVAPLYAGCTIAVSPSLQGEDILTTIKTHNVSLVIAVPRLYEVMLRNIISKIEATAAGRMLWNVSKHIHSRAVRKMLFSAVHKKFGGHIRWFISGGAKLNTDTASGFWQLGFEMLEGYGMSETSPIISFPRKGTYRLGSVGQPLIPHSVRIKDGEIQVRGPHVMKGYLNKPEQTAKAFDGEWLKTGDIGYLDDDNNLFVTGRKKELIVLSNGKNIQPDELESRLTARFPEIVETAVFADENGQLHALIVPDTAEINRKGIRDIHNHFRWEVIDAFNRDLPSYKRITAFSLLSEPLPRTRLQKLRRFMLPQLAQTHAPDNSYKQDAPKSPLYTMILSFLQRVTNKTVYPDSHIEIDLGVDSLDRMELAARIRSESGFPFEDSMFAEHPTPRKIVEFIERNNQKDVSDTTRRWKQILKESTVEQMPYSAFPHNTLRVLLTTAVKQYFSISCHRKTPLPTNTPLILVANHQSFLDPLFIVSCLPASFFKRLYFIAKSKHFNRRWKNWIGQRGNVIVLKPGASALDALKSMSFVLRKGGSILIFPEGTRTRSGSMGTFKESFALLAAELNVPVIPIALNGAFEAFPIHAKLPKFRATITVSFLNIVQSKNQTKETIAEITRTRIEKALSEKRFN